MLGEGGAPCLCECGLCRRLTRFRQCVGFVLEEQRRLRGIVCAQCTQFLDALHRLRILAGSHLQPEQRAEVTLPVIVMEIRHHLASQHGCSAVDGLGLQRRTQCYIRCEHR
ncbi:hypothetical protein D3C81_719990 [compost metagenome]